MEFKNLQNLQNFGILNKKGYLFDLGIKYDKYKDNIIEVLDMMINYFRDIMMLKEKIGKDMIINILKQMGVKKIYVAVTAANVPDEENEEQN